MLMAKKKPAKLTSPPLPKALNIVGDPLPWTEADFDRLSEITEEDKAAAKAFWRRQAPRKLKRIIDASKK
jgi:hypothetical protein